MKSNVDLTLNNDFSKNRVNRGGISIEDFIVDRRSLYPWNDVYTLLNSLDVASKKDKELVFTGDAKERERKKFWDEEEGQRWLECDRCGAFTKKYPWDTNEGTLCKDCDEWLNNRGEKVPWRGGRR